MSMLNLDYSELEDFLNKISQLGIKISLSDNQLKINSPKGVLSAEIKDQLTKKKIDIIEYLKEKENNSKKYSHYTKYARKQNNTAPLSFSQQRLWFLYRLNPESPVYNIPAAFYIKENINFEILKKSLKTLVKRHEILRTTFHYDNGKPIQIISDVIEIPLKEINLDTKIEAERFIKKQVKRIFNLVTGPVFEVYLIKLNENENILLLNIHHIIADAWSCGIFAQELMILYKSISSNVDTSNLLPELEVQYSDYSYIQQDFLNSEQYKKQLDYWVNKLKDSNTTLNLPYDKKPILSNNLEANFKGKTIIKNIPDSLCDSLKKLSEKLSVTPFVLYISAFHVLLHRYTSDEDILTGFPIAGRQDRELEKLIGFFVNTLIIRSDFSNDIPFSEFVKQVNKTVLEALDNQELPFEKIVEALQPQRKLNGTPLFQTMFVMQNIDFDDSGLNNIELIETDTETSKFDITLSVRNNGKTFSLEYKTELFYDESAERFINSYIILLQSIASNHNENISKLNIIDQNTYDYFINDKIYTHKTIYNNNNQDIVKFINDSDESFLNDFTINKIVEYHAIYNPQQTALIFNNEKISYKELNEKSNAYSHYLINQGLKIEDKVGVFIDVSIEMIISLLAILKAGGTYIPLEEKLPEERINFIIDDSKPIFIITKDNIKNKIEKIINNNYLDTTLLLINDYNDVFFSNNLDNPDIKITGSNSAYIIYTSGSTGKPNGVVINHDNVIRLFISCDKLFLFDNKDKWVLFHSFAFDYSIWEIWGCFFWGAELLLVPIEMTRDTVQFYKKICEEKVTVLNQTPSAFYNFSRQAIKLKNEINNNLKYIVLSGEATDVELLKDWYNHFNDTKIVNCYGITETTVFVTFKLLEKDDIYTLDNSKSPIGLALDDLSLYILDKNLKPVPKGIEGELFVGGKGLAREYLNRTELTQNRFIKNPFGSGRLYKTGDKVRALKDNTIEFIGRLDKQIKIRGYRIELGEIENVINQFKSIKESVVIPNLKHTTENNDKYLIAYIVSENDSRFADENIKELKSFLKTKLTDVMIPRFFIQLDNLPLNNNGKVDKKVLPKHELSNTKTNNKISEFKPKNKTEKELYEIFKELLGIENIDIYDNFFEIGAHSLLMLEAQNKIQEKLNINIDLTDLFNYPNISLLSDFISGYSNEKKIRKIKNNIDKDNSDIAIIGMAAKFPGADDIEKYWENVSNGIESVHFFSDDELRNLGVDESTIKNDRYIKANAILNDIEYFDADFFGYNPREAEIIDPQQRIFLQTCYTALEHAGYDPESKDNLTGIFAGTSISRYLLLNLYPNKDLISSIGYFQLLTANDKDYLSTRVAYKLGLKGPAITVQTACSTSLVSVHLACKSLLAGDCNMALAGGVSIDTQRQGYFYTEGSINSPDGHCRAFDSKAQGIVGGSGSGVVVLKRLKDAIKDGDSIYAVIKSSVINNDGSQKVGFLAPSVEGQAEAVFQAINESEIDPESISYIETHGTATQIGDPIEISALTKAYREFTNKKNYCAIGSVKTNIGHLDMAAGIAGLIKTVQSIRYEKIPPSLHFISPNPKIDFINSPFYVNTYLKEWKSSDNLPLRAGVSSFGVGGTNAHIILEQSKYTYLENDIDSDKNDLSDKLNYDAIFISAKTEEALYNHAKNILDFIKYKNNINLADIAYTLKEGRHQFKYKFFCIVDSIDKLIEKLTRFISEAENNTTNVSNYVISGNKKAKNVFLFSGLGTQFFKAGYQIYKNNSIFKNEVDKCAEVIKKETGFDILNYLFNDESEEYINKPYIMQPVVFLIEYAMSKLLISMGVKPCALIGHSIGEYAAACISEIISLEDALSIICLRGKLFEKINGAMLAVSINKDKVLKYLDKNVYLSAINSDNLCLLSCTDDYFEELKLKLKNDRIAFTVLNIPHSTHCEMVSQIENEFLNKLKQIKFNEPKIPIISNITGEYINSEMSNPDYWITQMKNTVRFSDSLNTLKNDDNLVFIETGSGNSLTSLIRKNSSIFSNDIVLINTISIKQNSNNEYSYFLNSIATLWSNNVSLTFQRKNGIKRIALPTYPFEKKKYWIEAPKNNNNNQEEIFYIKKENKDNWYYINTWKRSTKISDNFELNKDINYMIYDATTDNKNIFDNVENYFNLNNKNIIKVKSDNKYENINNNDFYIRGTIKEDYISLFDKLKEINQLPDKIIYFVDNEYQSELEDYNRDQKLHKYFIEPVYFTQAIAEVINKEIEIIIITSNINKIIGNEDINTEKSLLKGLISVANQEYKNISYKLIDIDSKTNIKYILSEILLKPDNKNNDNYQSDISYRNNYRWNQSIEKVTLNKNNTNYLKHKGVYIITGGFGGIALVIAELLLKKYNAKVILLVRKNIIESNHLIKEKIEYLKAINNQVYVYESDISEYESMYKLFTQIKDEFTQINGVIHTAGKEGSGLIQNITFEKSLEVLKPKVYGTEILYKLGNKFDIDFLFLFSSLNSILGGVGNSDYCSANSFIDAFSEKVNDEVDKLSKMKVISVNWGSWQQTGMAQKMIDKYKNTNQLFKSFYEEVSKEGILPDEGIEIFENIMQSDLTNIFISPVNLNSLKNRYDKLNLYNSKNIIKELSKKISKNNLYSRPNLDTEYISPTTETEITITEIWKEFLGIEKIGINDNFFELGGYSLLSAGIKIALEEKLGFELPMSILLNSTTIKQTANNIHEFKNNNDNSSNIVALKTSGNKTPFFCVHAVSGTTFPFISLSAKLDNSRPFYGIQSYGFNDNEIPIDNIEEMAKTYRDSIKKIRKDEPFIIAGWSFGAVVALEMVRQLRIENNNKVLLIIFDMRAPLKDKDILNLKINDIDENSLKKRFMQDMYGLFGDQNLNNNEMDSFYKIFKENIKAAEKYDFSKYLDNFKLHNQRIILFKAENGLFKDYNENLDWENLTSDLISYKVSGDHYSMLNNSDLTEVLAIKLNEFDIDV